MLLQSSPKYLKNLQYISNMKFIYNIEKEEQQQQQKIVCNSQDVDSLFVYPKIYVIRNL